MLNRKARRAAKASGESLPDNDALFQEGLALHKGGQLFAAERIYRQILKADSDHVNALQFLGLLAYQMGALGDAVAWLRRAIRLEGRAHGAWSNLGNALLSLGKYGEAAEAYRTAIDCGAGMLTYSNLSETYREMGRYSEAARWGRLAADRSEGTWQEQAEAHSKLLYVQAYGATLSPDELLADSRAWFDRFWNPAPRLEADDRDPDRPLRIGFASADFRTHAVMQCAEATFAGFRKRNDVETFAYSSHFIADDTTERLKATLHHWRPIVALSDEQAAGQIRADKIDVLVDLSGRTMGHRLGIFALRPAPILAGYIGPLATSGMPMDYLIVDRVTCPEDSPEKATEQFWRLPRCYMSFRPPADAPEVSPPPKAPLTFGSFNALAKLGPETVRLWSAVLNAIPESRLLLKAKGLREMPTRARLLVAFAAQGVNAKRITFLEATKSTTDHLAAYSRMHIALDPTPFSGGATTQEALWMGVPVVTLPGERMVGRWSASLLDAARFPHWVARTEEEFVAIAKTLAASDLTSLRAVQRGIVAKSPLCDGGDLAAALAEALRGMWRRYLEA